MVSFRIPVPSWRRLSRLVPAIPLLALVACGGGGGEPGTADTAKLRTAGQRIILLNTFAATLSGASAALPAPGAVQGTGTLTINPDTRRFTATLTTHGIAGTAVHIHEGLPGVVGPVLYTLTQTAVGSGVWMIEAVLNDALIASFRAGNMYFDVVAPGIPEGTVRGQILFQEEIPVSQSEAGASGTGIPVGS